MIYLDNSATTFPKPREVAGRMGECMRQYCANPGRSGHRMSMRIGNEIYECREKIARMFNVPFPGRVIFTSNATEALNIAIKGLLRKGDHVIITSMEHNSVLRPVHKLKERGLVDYSVARANIYGYVPWEETEALIRPNTRLIVMTHASNVCGTVNPVRKVGEIAKKHNIPFLVDGAQSAGIIPIDMERDHISALALPGHKALYGPMGTGVLCLGRNINPDPLKEGGTGTNSKEAHQSEEVPDKYESGTVNGVGICGLSAGLDFINRVGMDTIYNHDMHLTGIMLEDLSVIKGVGIQGYLTCTNRLGVISITIDGKDPAEVAAVLDKHYGIAVRAGYHCSPLAHETLGTFDTGSIRFSIGAFNTLNDTKTAVYAIDQICKTDSSY